MGLRIIKTDTHFELVDDKCRVIAREPINATLSTDSSGHKHDESGKFTAKDAHEASIDAQNKSHSLSETSEGSRHADQAAYNAKWKNHEDAREAHQKAERWHRTSAADKRAGSLAPRHKDAAEAHAHAAKIHKSLL